MRKIFFTFFILFFTLELFSTAQIPDKIIYNKKEYSLFVNPLESFFENNPEKRPDNSIRSSALWRGYMATFEVIDNQLYVKDIQILDYDNETHDYIWVSAMNEVFPDQEIIKLDWYTGLLIIPNGELKEYVHMGYSSTYSKYIILEIHEGNLKKEKELNNKNYESFKERQFEAFMKTEEFNNILNELKNETNYPEEQLISFLKSFVIEYSTKILVE